MPQRVRTRAGTRWHIWSLAIACIAFVLMGAVPTTAANLSPVGRWLTIDDKTQTPRSIIEIRLDHGTLKGTVVQMLNRSADLPGAVCRKCTGSLKDAPILGMTIMWGLTNKGGSSWSDGSILDPRSGYIYSVRIEVEDGGKKLLVRGYLGISLLGRSQIWIRQS